MFTILVTLDMQKSVLKDCIYDVPVIVRPEHLQNLLRVLEDSKFCVRYRVTYKMDDHALEPDYFALSRFDFPKWNVNQLAVFMEAGRE